MQGQQIVFQLTEAIIKFNVNPDNQLIITGYFKNNSRQIFQTKFIFVDLPLVIKQKYQCVQDYFSDLQFQANQQDFTLVKMEDQAKLQIRVDPPCEVILKSTSRRYKVSKIATIENKKAQSQQSKNKLKDTQQQLDKQLSKLQALLKSRQQVRDKNIEMLLQLNEQQIMAQFQVIQSRGILELAKTKYVQKPSIQKIEKYSKHTQQQNGKKRFVMQNMQVTDKIIQDFLQYDLSKIQILSLGNNKITDQGFTMLFKNNQWPVLGEILLQNNHIENIHSLNKIDVIQTLVLFQNPLSQASCQFLCQFWWPWIKVLRISFKTGLAVKCYKKLLQNLQQKFPNLNQLCYSKNQQLTTQIQLQLLKYCNSNNIRLNHSFDKQWLKGNLILKLQLAQILADLTNKS